MPLAAPFFPNVARRHTEGGKMLSLAASLGNPCGMLYDPAGKPMPVYHSLPIEAEEGTTNVIDGVEGYIIVVLSLYGMAGAVAGDLHFTSLLGEDAVKISGKFSNAVRGGEVLNHNSHGWFATAPGAALQAVLVGGDTEFQLNYCLLNGSYFYNEDGTVRILEDGEPALLEG